MSSERETVSYPKGKVAREREHLSPAIVAQGTFGNEIEQKKMRLCKQPQERGHVRCNGKSFRQNSDLTTKHTRRMGCPFHHGSQVKGIWKRMSKEAQVPWAIIIK